MNFQSEALEQISKFATKETIPTKVVLPALKELIDGVREGDVISDLSAWDTLVEQMENA